MTFTQIALFAGLAGYLIATQVGRHRVTLHRFILPVAAVVFVGFQYLKGIPTAGGDLNFELILSLVGVGFGLVAAGCVRIERDPGSGRLMMRAGIAYALVWIVALGGRLAFAWAATHGWGRQVGEFSMQHAITGSAAWTAAFILMALAMVGTRTVVLGTRSMLAARQARLVPAINQA